jgi:HSP20 family protein
MAWDPARDLLTMQERLESLFGRAAPGWVPPVDLLERTDSYVLSVELPGLRREDVRIEGSHETVVVSGQRPGPVCCPGRYHQLERGQGSFSRSFRFTHAICIDEISAELIDGVLTITVPKSQTGSSHISVK